MWYRLAYTSWVEWVAMLALAAMILRLGWQVRSYLKGDRPNLDGIRAARTLALAKAGSLTGAALLGRYGAVVLVTITSGAPLGAQTVQAGIAALIALGLIVGSLIAERWCELPPSEAEPSHTTRNWTAEPTPAVEPARSVNP
jgi:hypothetical protein